MVLGKGNVTRPAPPDAPLACHPISENATGSIAGSELLCLNLHQNAFACGKRVLRHATDGVPPG